jgi:uncharacterized delta-60 repeat protein
VTAYRIARLNPDGTPDETFNPGGAGANKAVRAMAFASDGKIYIGGDFTSYNGTPVTAFARLNKDGTLDTTFNAGGAGFTHSDASKLYISSIAVDTDGDVYVAGRFEEYNGTAVSTVVRLNSDGSRDSGFAPAKIVYTPSSTTAPIVPNFVKVIGDRVFVSGQLDEIQTDTAVSVSGMAIFSKTGAVDDASKFLRLSLLNEHFFLIVHDLSGGGSRTSRSALPPTKPTTADNCSPSW